MGVEEQHKEGGELKGFEGVFSRGCSPNTESDGSTGVDDKGTDKLGSTEACTSGVSRPVGEFGVENTFKSIWSALAEEGEVPNDDSESLVPRFE